MEQGTVCLGLVVSLAASFAAREYPPSVQKKSLLRSERNRRLAIVRSGQHFIKTPIAMQISDQRV